MKGSAQPVDEPVVNPNGAFGSRRSLKSENEEGPGRNRGLLRSCTEVPTVVGECCVLDEGLEIVEKLRLPLGAHDASGLLTVLEHDHGGNAHDAEATSNIGIVIDVELGDGQAAGLLVGDLFKDGGDHLARTTPLGPEVNDDGDS